MEVMQTTDSIF